MKRKISIATRWRDATEGTLPYPSAPELKRILADRRTSVANITSCWQTPKVDKLPSVEFSDFVVLAKIDHYLANGLDEQ